MTSASVRRAAGFTDFAVDAAGLAAARVEGAGFAGTDFADVLALGLAAREVAGFADLAPGRWAAFFTGFLVGMRRSLLLPRSVRHVGEPQVLSRSPEGEWKLESLAFRNGQCSIPEMGATDRRDISGPGRC
jgi:hypothetical protein